MGDVYGTACIGVPGFNRISGELGLRAFDNAQYRLAKNAMDCGTAENFTALL